ncbi:ATP-dependent Clp protease ATP-binding subunit CLPT1, chloroplastic-like [Iris pallida]|uniref:ATP-dependent Clp protease ATP-binding subunit CLPT1, chloroplastic-like n=1 Tax=Iris pallida TaxID=29817 RepID=A0AAX6HAQ3_IRIPA|nr:ATP-dependent Clp protease ATP-binding subunit CLPT1, chloroplastic-like [Iris pallida]
MVSGAKSGSSDCFQLLLIFLEEICFLMEVLEMELVLFSYFLGSFQIFLWFKFSTYSPSFSSGA